MREFTFNRDTKETKISLKINLDGSGVNKIDTGIAFFDHMLQQISTHSLIDLELKCNGDLKVDMHHTVEDVGIALGESIKNALGDKKGITRFSHSYVSFDDTLTRSVIDLCNRPYFIWNVKTSLEKVGEMDQELFSEFFKSIVTESRMNCHIETLYGKNNHHIIESCFKSFAISLKKAISIDPKKNKIPSSKGKL
jgi:imidazoleglycerol-phosphate dehydratase|tara:strand:- start:206 stop:790 length:585 start_codon:yes stop_codon:yes gene_type:complete